MTRDEAKEAAAIDWGDDNSAAHDIAWGIGFDAGWSAAIRAVAAAVPDGAEFDRLIEEPNDA